MKKVKIYSTPTCHYCAIAKEAFARRQIPYTEYDVQNDLKRRKEMVKISGQMGVPVIVFGDKVMVGFERTEFDEEVFKYENEKH